MKKILITVIAFGFVTGCSVFGSIGGSAGSIGGSAGSSAGSSGGSSGSLFGKRRTKEIVLEQRVDVADIRILIPVVNEVKVDKYRGGALIRARGTVDRQGYSDINLVALNDGLPDENGVVTYEFKGEKPLKTVLGPTARSKEVFAGAAITAIRLPSVKRIRVIAGQNQIIVAK